MTTPTPIPDFCVSSNADGFDEFLKVFNEHLRDIVGFADNKRTGYYYGYENGSPISIQEAWIPLILTHQAIALLSAKPLTEGDLIVAQMFTLARPPTCGNTLL